MTIKTIRMLFASAILSTAAALTPAHAGGQISIEIVPGSSDSARALRLGLGLYALSREIKSGAGIRQNGSGNMAGIGQNGSGNFGVVHQDGNGHSGTLNQNGNNNSCGLFQFGENTSGHVSQNGNGGTCAAFQFGWD
jgi:minor curlin subunit